MTIAWHVHKASVVSYRARKTQSEKQQQADNALQLTYEYNFVHWLPGSSHHDNCTLSGKILLIADKYAHSSHCSCHKSIQTSQSDQPQLHHQIHPHPHFTNNKYSLSIYFRTAMSTGNPSGAGCMPRTRRAAFKAPLFLCRRRFFLRSAHYRKGVPRAYPSAIGSISGHVFL